MLNVINTFTEKLQNRKGGEMRKFRLTWIIDERILKQMLKGELIGTSAEKVNFVELSGDYCPKCKQETQKKFEN